MKKRKAERRTQMKKQAALSLGMLFALTAICSPVQAQEQETNSESSVLIAYFSVPDRDSRRVSVRP